jgi:hypothetical protein
MPAPEFLTSSQAQGRGAAQVLGGGYPQEGANMVFNAITRRRVEDLRKRKDQEQKFKEMSTFARDEWRVDQGRLNKEIDTFMNSYTDALIKGKGQIPYDQQASLMEMRDDIVGLQNRSSQQGELVKAGLQKLYTDGNNNYDFQASLDNLKALKAEGIEMRNPEDWMVAREVMEEPEKIVYPKTVEAKTSYYETKEGVTTQRATPENIAAARQKVLMENQDFWSGQAKEKGYESFDQWKKEDPESLDAELNKYVTTLTPSVKREQDRTIDFGPWGSQNFIFDPAYGPKEILIRPAKGEKGKKGYQEKKVETGNIPALSMSPRKGQDVKPVEINTASYYDPNKGIWVEEVGIKPKMTMSSIEHREIKDKSGKSEKRWYIVGKEKTHEGEVIDKLVPLNDLTKSAVITYSGVSQGQLDNMLKETLALKKGKAVTTPDIKDKWSKHKRK